MRLAASRDDEHKDLVSGAPLPAPTPTDDRRQLRSGGTINQRFTIPNGPRFSRPVSSYINAVRAAGKLEDDVNTFTRCFFVSLFAFVFVFSGCAEFGGGWNDEIPEDVPRMQLGLKIEFNLDQAYQQHGYNIASGIRPTLMGYVETEGGKYHQRRELVMCPLSWNVSTCTWEPEISVTDGVERFHVRITGQLELRSYADFTIRLAEGNDPTRPFLIRLPTNGRPAEYFTRFLGPERGVRAGNVSIVPTYHRIE